MKERLSENKSSKKAIVRIGVELGVLLLLTQSGNIKTSIEEAQFSSNISDYSWVVKTNDEVCYTKESPTLSKGLEFTILEKAYCPTEVNGKQKHNKLLLPSASLTLVTRTD